MQETRPYRKCVRVFILKDNKIALGKRYNDQKQFIKYAFPGGGVDLLNEKDHNPNKDQYLKAVIAAVEGECLEEVGIAVKNVQLLGLVHQNNFEYPKPERAKQFRGSEDIWCVCQYAGVSKTLHGKEGDALPFKWETIDNTMDLISNGPITQFTSQELEALNLLKKHIGYNSSKLKNW